MLDGVDQDRNRRGPGSRPGLAFDRERLELDLDVEAAGASAGSLRVEIVPLCEKDVDAGLREVVRCRAAGQSAADDERIAAAPWQARAAVGSRTPCTQGDSMPAEFRGSYTVIVTPFTADGSRFDVEAQRRFLDWQIASRRSRA